MCVLQPVAVRTHAARGVWVDRAIYRARIKVKQRTNVKERERDIERECVKVRKRTLFLMGTAALYRVCSTGLR